MLHFFVLFTTFIVSSRLTTVRCTPNQVALIIRPAEMARVWWDKGSGAERDVTTYTPSNCLKLGDSATPHYNTDAKPIGYCVQEVVPGSLAVPLRLNKIWDDSGSGADEDGSFWYFDCPQGYVDLGHASSKSHSPPSIDNYRCIKTELTTTENARLKFIWNDRKSGARRDVSVFGLDCYSPSTADFDNVIVAFATYNVGTTTRRCIPRVFYQIESGSPVWKVEVKNLNYDLDRRILRGQGNPSGHRATVMNCFKNGVQQSPSKELSISYDVTHSWTWETTMSVGTTMSVSANAPFDLGGVEVSVTSTVTNGQGYTSTKSETRAYKVTAPINVPPGKQITTTVTLQLNKYDVPFVAQATYYRRDGSVSYGEISGLYRGMEVADTIFTYGALLDC